MKALVSEFELSNVTAEKPFSPSEGSNSLWVSFLIIVLFFGLIIFSVIEPDVESPLEEKDLLSLCSAVSVLHPKRFEVNVKMK